MRALPISPDSLFPVVNQGFSGKLRIGILSTFPPTVCGLAAFSAALANSLEADGAEVAVVQVSDGTPPESPRVIGELVTGSRSSAAHCADMLNRFDVAIIQHDHRIYGGAGGAEVIEIIRALSVPSVVVAHRIPEVPTRQQRVVLENVAAVADQVVVMCNAANRRLHTGYHVERGKVTTIPHGATVPSQPSGSRVSRPTIVTWGLLGPGKGVERVIDAMPSLGDLPGKPRYVVAGRTHPRVLATEGEAYRDSLVEQARRLGVAGAVTFDAGYRSAAMLSALAQSAKIVVLPFDSTDQISSGVLVDAIANGRPVVATAFPHAVELLATGAGIVVPHDDPGAMASALRRVLSQPRLAGDLAAEARRLAPDLAWPVVGAAYLKLVRRLLVHGRARA